MKQLTISLKEALFINGMKLQFLMFLGLISLSSAAKADTISDVLNPPIGDFFGRTDQEKQAINSASRAFLIQTGYARFQDQISHYVSRYQQERLDQVQTYVQKEMGDAPIKTIGFLAYSYRVYRDRTISLPVHKNTRVQIGQDHVNLTINF